MRYADFAYQHAKNRDDDPSRLNALDKKAQAAGFSNTADYIDHVQQNPSTKSAEGGSGRVKWVNKEAGLEGINNPQSPEKSTVHPSRRPEKGYENFKREEAKRTDLGKEALKDRGPLTAKDLRVEPKSQIREGPVQRPGETVGSASKPRDQAEVLKAAQDKQRDTPDQKLTPEQRRAALQEASAAVAQDQAQQKKAWEAETDPKKKEQMALKAGIEQTDFKRQTARENADLTAQEKGAQSPQALKAKSESRAADKAHNQGVADWHKRSVRDSSYEPFDKKWSNEAERAKARESKSKDPQEKKDTALERQFNTTAGHGKGHGM